MKRLSPYTQHSDDRGLFIGITREQWAEVNFVETSANQTRGNHYHLETRELFFVISGQVHIEITDIRRGSCTSFTAGKGDMFIVDPYELHTFHTETDSAWINMLSQSFDSSAPDFHYPDPLP